MACLPHASEVSAVSAATAGSAWPLETDVPGRLANPGASALPGLPWMQGLSQLVQGRLAACSTVAEALDELDDALDWQQAGGPAGRGRLSAGVRVGRWGGRQQAAGDGGSGRAPQSAPPELVVASVDLLMSADTRVKELEDELRRRQERHEETVQELRRHHRADRHRALQRLLGQLAPPGFAREPNGSELGSSFREAAGHQAALNDSEVSGGRPIFEGEFGEAPSLGQRRPAYAGCAKAGHEPWETWAPTEA